MAKDKKYKHLLRGTFFVPYTMCGIENPFDKFLQDELDDRLTWIKAGVTCPECLETAKKLAEEMKMQTKKKDK